MLSRAGQACASASRISRDDLLADVDLARVGVDDRVPRLDELADRAVGAATNRARWLSTNACSVAISAA